MSHLKSAISSTLLIVLLVAGCSDQQTNSTQVRENSAQTDVAAVESQDAEANILSIDVTVRTSDPSVNIVELSSFPEPPEATGLGTNTVHFTMHGDEERGPYCELSEIWARTDHGLFTTIDGNICTNNGQITLDVTQPPLPKTYLAAEGYQWGLYAYRDKNTPSVIRSGIDFHLPESDAPVILSADCGLGGQRAEIKFYEGSELAENLTTFEPFAVYIGAERYRFLPYATFETMIVESDPQPLEIEVAVPTLMLGMEHDFWTALMAARDIKLQPKPSAQAMLINTSGPKEFLSAFINRCQNEDIYITSIADDAPVEGQHYVCTSGDEFHVQYNANDTLSLFYKGESTNLNSVVSASGSKYENETITLWTKGELAQFQPNASAKRAKTLSCVSTTRVY